MDILRKSTLHNSLPDLLGGVYHLNEDQYHNISGFTESNYVHTYGNEYISGDKTFYNSVYINGNLTVSGTTITADQLHIVDNIITINSGETGSGVTLRYSGIEIDRGVYPNYVFIFDENDDSFRIGETGDTQAVATREDNPISNAIAFWNSGATRFDTNSNFYYNSNTLYVNISATTISATTLYYKGEELDNRFVNVTGDTMTGDLTINANLTVTGDTIISETLSVNSLSANTEVIVTTSGNSGLLQSYLTTDSYYIKNTTIISDLLNESFWSGKTYLGTVIGAVEGQEYIGPNYRYLYKDSIFTRYQIDSDTFLICLSSTTIDVNTNIVICNSPIPITITLPNSSTCVFSQIFIKNLNAGVVTVTSSTLIDEAYSKDLNQYESIHLGIDKTQYYIISDKFITSLSGLSDVTITSPTNGQILYYEDSNWYNRNLYGDTKFITDNYNQLSTDYIIICNATNDITIQLLITSGFTNGYSLIVKNTTDTKLTIKPNGIETIDGYEYIIIGKNSSLDLYTNGNNWFIV